jgi:hypothetical protein
MDGFNKIEVDRRFQHAWALIKEYRLARSRSDEVDDAITKIRKDENILGFIAIGIIAAALVNEYVYTMSNLGNFGQIVVALVLLAMWLRFKSEEAMLFRDRTTAVHQMRVASAHFRRCVRGISIEMCIFNEESFEDQRRVERELSKCINEEVDELL